MVISSEPCGLPEGFFQSCEILYGFLFINIDLTTDAEREVVMRHGGCKGILKELKTTVEGGVMRRSSKPRNKQKSVSLKYPNHRAGTGPCLEGSHVLADEFVAEILIIRQSVTNSLPGRTEPRLCELRTFSFCRTCQVVLLQYFVRDCTRRTTRRVHWLSARNGIGS